MQNIKLFTKFIVVFILFLCSTANAQTFQKSYGGSSEEFIYGTELLSDGGYILCGRTITGTMNGSWDAYVLRLNSAGDTLWTRNYGNVGYDEFQSVKPTADGGFIFAGTTDNTDAFYDIFLVKTDASGVVTWSTSFGSDGTGDQGFSVRQTADLGYIIAGHTQSAGAGGRDMVLIKTTSTGVVSWSKTYGGASDDEGRCVEETSDGYIVAGVTSSYGNGIQSYVVKTNATGVVTWSKTFGGSNTEYALSIKQTNDNGYVVAGYTDSYGAGNYDALLLKLTSAGALSWAKTYGGSDIDMAGSIKIISDGYVLAGRTASFGAGAGDYYLIKTDASGVIAWSKAYGGSLLDQAYNVVQTSDGGYVLTGYANSYGAGSKDGYVIKTDASGVHLPRVVANTTTNTPTVTNGTGATEGTGLSAASPGPTTARRKTTMSVGTQCFVAVVSCPVNASFTPSATSVCVGASVTFTNTTTGGAIGQAWYENNVLFSTAQSTQRTFNTAGTFTIQLIATNGTCQDTATATITVNALPTATITPGSPTTFCQGGSVTLTASAGSSWLWAPGGQTSQSINVTTGGTYSVTVTNANNCSATSSPTTVTVNPLPTATITPSGNTTFCQGGSVTLTASAGSSWLWAPGGQITQSINVTSGGTYSVTVTNGNNCSATSSGTTVTVTPSVTPSVTITANPPLPVCPGTCVTFTAIPVNGGILPNLNWENNGSPEQNSTATTYTTCTLQNADLLSLIMTSNATCASPSVVANAVNVVLYPAPVATITPGGPTTFCTGGSVTLTASAGSSWLWAPGGQTTQSVNVTTPGNYTVTVTNANNCSTTSAATNVTVLSQPTATITPSGVTTFCQGGSVTLTANQGTSYLWSPGGQTSQSINVTTPGNYTVTVNNGVNCTATSSATTVTVNPLPTAIITHTGVTACNGDSILLTASAGTSWLWTPGGATTQSIYALQQGGYSVTVTNQYNCSATTDTALVTIVSPPNVNITANGPTTFCEGGMVTLTANPAGIYSWSPGGQNTQSITVMASGTYTATITAWPNCTASATTIVTVNPLPTPPVITLNNGVLQSNMATGNTWYMTGMPTVLGTNQTYTPTQDGYYSLSYTDANGCTSLFDSVYVDITGIAEIASNNGINIYPNPADDIITISNYQHIGAVYTLFDGLGRVVLSGNFTAENTNINIGGLAPGTYILTINGNKRQSFKVMKQ